MTIIIWLAGKGFCPRATVALKYSGKGGYSRKSLPMGVDEKVANVLTEALNASKTKTSRGNHQTAIRHICTYVAYLRGKGTQPLPFNLLELA